MRSCRAGALLGVALLAALAAPPGARAQCAACLVGDPTLTSLGAEQPFAGRLRASLDLSYRTSSTGEAGRDLVEVSELRGELGVAWAPTASFGASLGVPLVHRDVSYVNGGRDRVFSLGDVQLRGKLFLFRDRALAPRHLLAAIAGVRVPTGPRLHDDTGRDISPDAQIGTGTVEPSLGVVYAFFAEPWHGLASVIGAWPLFEAYEHLMGPSVLASLAGQYQIVPGLAARLGVDGRFDAPTRMAGAQDPNSGGLVVFVTGAVLVEPRADVTCEARFSWPLVRALRGAHDEGLVVGVSGMVDL